MLHSDVEYLDLELVCRLHRDQIREYGGIFGIRDVGLLEAAIDEPKATFDQIDLYPTVFDKAAVIFVSLVQNHPFIDGNKRIGVAAATLFLLLNKFELTLDPDALYSMAIGIATSQISVTQASLVLKQHSITGG